MASRVASILVVFCVLGLAGCTGKPDKSGKFLQRGKDYAEKKDYARAVLQFRNEAKVLPKSPEPYYQLGLAYLSMRDGRAAFLNFKKAVELDPNHIDAQIKLAEMMATSQEKTIRKEAEEVAKGVLKRSPDNPDALTIVAVTEIASGDEQAGEQQLLTALAKAPKHLKSSMVLAALKTRRGDFSGAEAVLKSVAEGDPKSAEAALALGRFYVMRQRTIDAAREFDRAVKLQPTNSGALLSLARLQFASGNAAAGEETLRTLSALPEKEYRTMHALFVYQNNRDAAISELERICASDPTDRKARALLARMYAFSKRVDEAEKLLSSSLKDNSKDTDALLQRAEILLQASKYTEAQNDLAQVLRFIPDSARAHLLLARLHQMTGATLQGRQELNEALRLDPNLLDARLDIAEDYLRGRNAAAALEIVNSAPQIQKQSVPVLTKRNKILLAMGKLQEARTGIDEALKVARTRELLLLDSQLRLAQKDYRGARESSEEVLKSSPEDVAALAMATLSFAEEKRPDAALQRIRDQVALRPSSVQLQYFLGLQLIGSKKNTEAREALGTALQADKNFFPAALELAKLEISDGRLVEARRLLTPLLTSKVSEVNARMLLAQIEITSSNSAGAIEHYRRVLDVSPRNPLAMNNLASILVDQDNGVDEALKYAQQTKEIAPGAPAVDDTLGWAFYRKGIYRTAIRHLETAATRSPDPAVKYHLAMAYFKVGDLGKAQDTFQKAWKQHPSGPEATAARQLIAQH